MVRLLARRTDRCSALRQKKGIEKVPEHKRFKTPHLYTGEDRRGEIMASAGKKGTTHSLSAYGYSVAPGETVAAVGEYSEGGQVWLLLEFSTDMRFGGGGGKIPVPSGEKGGFHLP